MSSFSITCRACLGLLAFLLTGYQAAMAAYPDKPIRFIVPAAPGGGADTTVRIVTTALAQRLGQPIVIDNKPGAAGAIGLDAIAKAPADGYTIGTANLSNFTVASNVAKNLPYNPSRDFSPIAMLITQPYLLGVTAGLPVKSVKELTAYGKANPKALFYGSSGNGSALHVVMELFRTSVGMPATHVPYKSIVAAQTDLMGGQIQLMIDNFSTMAPNVESGRVRALAVTGPKRSPAMPNVPTLAELGVPAAEAVTWAGVVGPARMPADVVNRLNAEINAVLADPKVQKQFADVASDPAPMTVAEFAQYIKAQDARWSAVIKKGNITAD
ncbi:MAG: tripartite tricarboxylate transporter receptor family protein [Ramlibacter sp.]|nr:tripartite tricarboxylate transporter receptor family protein [Ramlibacter sp.]